MADGKKQFYWRPDRMTAALALPAAVADRCLAEANVQQLRVLLWLARQQLVADPAACAAALGLTESELESCLRFWCERGILLPADPAGTAPAPQRPTARPAAVKPLVGEVLEYQKRHPDFSAFVEEVSARLGKPVGHSDTATLLYLLDTVGLPPQVILTEVVYAVSLGHANMRYIEKMALDWADRDLVTLEQVDEHIRHLESCRAAAQRLETLLALPRSLNMRQAETAEKWLDVWRLDEELLRRAAQITVEKKGQVDFAYLGAIIDRWHAEGIDTPEKIPAVTARKKGAAATNPEQSSLDLDGLDESLQRYTPVFGRHGKG